jgi:hypothetical protein
MGRTRVGGAAMHDGKLTGHGTVLAKDKPSGLRRSTKYVRHSNVPDIRRQHLVMIIHALGPKVAFELLDEIGHDHGINAEITVIVEQYARINSTTLRYLGSDTFAPSLCEVPK